MTPNSQVAAARAFMDRIMGFARWWVDEAAARIPARWRPLRGTELVAHVEGGSITLEERLPEGSRRPLGGLGQASPSLVGRRTTLVLSGDRILRRTLTLPRAAEAHLRDVVRLELDRRTPLRADQAWFAAETLARSPDGRTVEVAVAVLPRTAARDAVATVEAAGLIPVAVEVSDGDGPPVRMPIVEGVDRRGSAQLGPRVRIGVLAAAATLLAIYAVQAWRLDRLTTEAAAADADVAVVLATAERAAALRAKSFFAVERKQEAAAAVVVLEALARLLPDGTWLSELRFDGEGIRIAGLTDDSAGLVGLVEASPHFAEAQYRSAVVRDAGGRDRFNLSAKVVPHAAP